MRSTRHQSRRAKDADHAHSVAVGGTGREPSVDHEIAGRPRRVERAGIDIRARRLAAAGGRRAGVSGASTDELLVSRSFSPGPRGAYRDATLASSIQGSLWAK